MKSKPNSYKHFQMLQADITGLCFLSGGGGWTRTAGRCWSSRTTSKIFYCSLYASSFSVWSATNETALTVKHVNMGHFCPNFSPRWVILGPRWIQRPPRNNGPQRRQGEKTVGASWIHKMIHLLRELETGPKHGTLTVQRELLARGIHFFLFFFNWGNKRTDAEDTRQKFQIINT